MATSAIRQFKPAKRSKGIPEHLPPPIRGNSEKNQRIFKDITPHQNNDSKISIPHLVNKRTDSSVEVQRTSIHAQAREDVKNHRKPSPSCHSNFQVPTSYNNQVP